MINKEAILRQYIPSETVRSYMAENKITLSDRDWAAIIWNSSRYLSAREGDLIELTWTTEDMTLKAQIEERVAYDHKAIALFCDRHDGFIYALNSPEPDGEDNIIGYFRTAKLAADYGVEAGRDFQIRKHQLIDEGTEPIKGWCLISPVLEPDPEKQIVEFDFPGMPVAEISFNRFGTMMRYWTQETSREEALRVESLSRERFENAFVPVPDPFEEGDIVRRVGEDRTGIVKTSQREWQATLERALQPEALYDWMDVCLEVGYGETSEEETGINPLYLEKVTG